MGEQSWHRKLLSQATPEERRRLEEITNLKDSNLLTSSEAFLQQRLFRRAQDMLRVVSSELGRPVQADPKHIIGLAEDFAFRISLTLDLMSLSKESDAEGGYLIRHTVCNSLDWDLPVNRMLTRGRSQDPTGTAWGVNVKPFLVFLAVQKPEFLEQQSVTSRGLEKVYNYFMRINGSTPLLTHLASGEQMSLNEAAQNSEYWGVPKMHRESAIAGATGVYDPASPDRALEIQQIRAEAFEAWENGFKGRWTNHRFLLPRELLDLVYDPSAIYKRLLQADLLDEPWTRRKIAIACVYHFAPVDAFEKHSVKAVIDGVENLLLRREIRNGELLDTLRESLAASRVIENQRAVYEESAYLRSTVEENRSFLRKLFAA